VGFNTNQHATEVAGGTRLSASANGSPSQQGRGARLLLSAAALGISISACGTSAAAGGPLPAPGTVRLGYLTNLTHAPALIGVSKGFYQSSLPSGTTLQTKTFSAGPAENEALLGGSLDAAFVGPSPAINAFVSTKGNGIRIVAGAASGGAGLVVSPAIASGGFPADLKGQTLASPQLGNTQDVALRSWLSHNGLTSNIGGGGGDVSIDSSSGNAIDLQHFVAHQIAGGWEPEPYESQYILSGHGKLVVDEATLWPNGQYPTTLLVVTRTFLSQHPDIVADLLRGLMQTENWITQNNAAAPAAANAALASITGAKPLSAAVLRLAWSHLTFILDPLADDLQTEADHAHQAGLISSATIKGIVDVGPLNALLSAAGKPTVSAGVLGS
jgi:NitT/TauT family transport system substrate-binding protein